MIPQPGIPVCGVCLTYAAPRRTRPAMNSRKPGIAKKLLILASFFALSDAAGSAVATGGLAGPGRGVERSCPVTPAPQPVQNCCPCISSWPHLLQYTGASFQSFGSGLQGFWTRGEAIIPEPRFNSSCRCNNYNRYFPYADSKVVHNRLAARTSSHIRAGGGRPAAVSGSRSTKRLR